MPKTTCSLDRQQVLNGDTGEVIQDCPPSQGCSAGTCIDACDAARSAEGSVGCEFLTLPPDDRDAAADRNKTCFAAYIANTWKEPVTIRASYDGAALDLSTSVYVASATGVPTLLRDPLPVGQVAIVLLSSWATPDQPAELGCPGRAALQFDPIVHDTSLTKAIRLTTDRPVAAYSIFPYDGASGFVTTATLLLPVSTWGTSNLLVSPIDPMKNKGETNWEAPPPAFVQIVAAENGTTIKLRPSVFVSPGAFGSPPILGGPAGEVLSWTIQAGEVVQLTQKQELTGSLVSSDKPVAVFGGSRCTQLPGKIDACDILQQQIPPLTSWGSEYALVPPPPRKGATAPPELTPYRIVGAADGTELAYDAEYPPPPEAPARLNAGEVYDFSSNHPAVVRSQDAAHPFYAAALMTSAEALPADSAGSAIGDPDFVNLVPTSQALDHYVFYMEPAYPGAGLTLVRQKGANGFAPVELDCAGEIDNFQPIDPSGQVEVAHVRLVELVYVGLGKTRGVPQTFARGTCSAGLHNITSKEPFLLYVWGVGDYVSYGYPGGSGVRFSDKFVPPILR